MDEFDELDQTMAETRAARARHRADELKLQAERAAFHRDFRAWAEEVAAPTLEAVAEHLHALYEFSSVHVHHPDHRPGGRESVDLNISLMNEYVQLSFRAREPERRVGVSENHGAETVEPLEALTADVVRQRAIDVVTKAIARAGQDE